MTPELDEQLVNKYPKIFRDRHGDLRETAMCWGISCSDGWYWLLDHLCSSLQWETDKNKAPQVVASQVKEKFAGLRFYYAEPISEVQDGMIRLAQWLSQHICERCGATKNVDVRKEHGWLVTACEECWAT